MSIKWKSASVCLFRENDSDGKFVMYCGGIPSYPHDMIRFVFTRKYWDSAVLYENRCSICSERVTGIKPIDPFEVIEDD